MQDKTQVIDSGAKAISGERKLQSVQARLLSETAVVHETKPQQPSTDTPLPEQTNTEKSINWIKRANTHLSLGLGALALDGGLVVTALAFPDELLLLELPFLQSFMPGLVCVFGFIGVLGLGSGLFTELRKFF